MKTGMEVSDAFASMALCLPTIYSKHKIILWLEVIRESTMVHAKVRYAVLPGLTITPRLLNFYLCTLQPFCSATFSSTCTCHCSQFYLWRFDLESRK